MIIKRSWAMPSRNTFSIYPVSEIIHRHLHGFSVDPFANTNKIATVTNDIDPECGADHCMDAVDFMRTFDEWSVDTLLFDPPYSPRQVSECYRAQGRTVDMQTTQASFWSDLKREVARIVKPGGKVITCSWNSGGIGESMGFEIIEILLVAHGGWHNDTIVTVERMTDRLI